MTGERPAPTGVDVRTPNPARMYDYYLGGKDNFAADRDAAEEVLAVAPEARFAARENRAFLRRAVRLLAADTGIRQFIDLGTGLPTQDNVHQVAQRYAPDARVVYVDYDPVVCTHGRALLATDAQTITVQADLRHPNEVLNSPETRALIDFGEPVAVLFLAVLHFVTHDEDPARIIRRFRDAVAPGSYLVLSHASADRRTDAAERGARVYEKATSTMTLRTQEEIRVLFEGFDLLEPGVVTTSEWRPEGASAPSEEMAVLFGGVGRKP